MVFLLNIVFGLLAGYLSRYVMAQMKVTDPVNIILAVIFGIVVFLLNLAAHIV